MINLPKLNILFKQSGGSCVLSSYAIVSNYFTSIPIGKFFEDYCKHFGVNFHSWQEAEQKYASHFHNEWNQRHCKGYEVILDLHNNSGEFSFAESRNKFSGEFHDDSNPVAKYLEDQLLASEAFLNITYEPGKNYHSITAFYYDDQLIARDTNETQLFKLPSLLNIGKLRDSVLYKIK